MKSNQKTILFITIFLLLLNSALSETDYEELIEDDPAASFEQNPQKTWEALSQNPQLLEDPEVLKQAFENDPQKSIELINNNLELLNNPEVLDQFDSSIQDDINLLNNNKKAKKQWLKKKYNIKMSSGNTKILSYDGDFIKTGGKRGLKFRASDVPKAKILKDGSLKTPVGIFSNVKELKSVVQEGHGGTYKIVMSGGFIKAKPNNFHQDIDLKDGAKMTKFISDEGEITPITFKSVKGTIKVRLKDPFDETKLFSVESVGFNRIESDGRKMIVKGDFQSIIWNLTDLISNHQLLLKT